MDAFYASVEQRDRPELAGRPVVVGGDPHGRGVVASASYEARRFGIRSAMSCAKAFRLCPQATFLYPDISKYAEVSEKLHAIFEEVTDHIEPLSLDEAYLDVTTNRLNEPLARKIAVHIKTRIYDELKLTASAGVGPNKFIAKIASDMRKPNGLVVIPPDRVAAFVENLPVQKLWGVGPATAKRLNESGIRNTRDIRACGEKEIVRVLGQFGHFIFELAHGRDSRPVESGGEPKSRGSETTFERDVTDTTKLMDQIEGLANEVTLDLKKIERPARTITLKLRYSDFKTITRSKTLTRPTHDPSVIHRTACDLLFRNTDAGIRPVRLIGLTVSGFSSGDGPEQLWLEPLP